MTTQKRFFAILGIITGLILVQACGRKLPQEAPCNFVQNQDLQRVSWDRNLPVTLYLDSSVPSDYQSAIVAAVDKWNEVGRKIRVGNFFQLLGSSPGSSSPRQDGYNKIYVLNSWEDSKRTEQARTTVYWSGNRIYEADIRINREDFDYYFSDTPDYSKVHLESLMVHELGHVLGLAHNSTTESVMQVTLANGKSRVDPGNIDVNSLKCEY